MEERTSLRALTGGTDDDGKRSVSDISGITYDNHIIFDTKIKKKTKENLVNIPLEH